VIYDTRSPLLHAVDDRDYEFPTDRFAISELHNSGILPSSFSYCTGESVQPFVHTANAVLDV
jgi:hypothetical protein